VSEYTVGRIEQLTRAHKSARPKHENIAWVNTHRDLGIALKEIERLSSEVRNLKAAAALVLSGPQLIGDGITDNTQAFENRVQLAGLIGSVSEGDQG